MSNSELCICKAQTGVCFCPDACICKNCVWKRECERKEELAELIGSAGIRVVVNIVRFDTTIPVTFAWLMKLAVFFGTDKIDVEENKGNGGCETCGWGDDANRTIEIRDVKNWEGIR